MDYLDFELEIQPGSGLEYPVAVLRSPAGEARAAMHFPFDKLALENHLLKLQNALLRSGGKWRSGLSPEEEAVQTFGAALFDALFTGDVRTRYAVSWERAEREGLGLRLKLRILDPRLAALPWEFLYDPQQAEYVCLSRNSPLVRYLELPQRVPSLKVTPPLRILGMIASPRDQKALDVEREKARVERAVGRLAERGLVELTWLAGQTWRELQAALQEGPWHVFHFVGHGAYDSERAEGLVVLAGEDGRSEYLAATQLARLLADQRSLRLVLLNACEGARGGVTDVFSSTASILVRRGIPAVLAMQYAITDDAAIETARSFYGALARGLPVDAAVSEARKAVCLAVTNTLEWGTPVLYMRAPDGLLFDLQPMARVPPPQSVVERGYGEEVSSRAHERPAQQPDEVTWQEESRPAAQAEASRQASVFVEPSVEAQAAAPQWSGPESGVGAKAPPNYLFWLEWVLATAAGGILVLGASAMGGFGESLLSVILVFGTVGAVQGISQLFVLRQRTRVSGWWAVATIAGVTVGMTAALIFPAMVLRVMAWSLMGFALGTAQSFVLQKRISHSGWWILASGLGYGLGGWSILLVYWLGLGWAFLNESILVSYAFIALLAGAVTGVVLIKLLERSRERDSASTDQPA